MSSERPKRKDYPSMASYSEALQAWAAEQTKDSPLAQLRRQMAGLSVSKQAQYAGQVYTFTSVDVLELMLAFIGTNTGSKVDICLASGDILEGLRQSEITVLALQLLSDPDAKGQDDVPSS